MSTATAKDRVRAVPTGKVKWYDAEKGFGFVTQDGGEDVYIRKTALPHNKRWENRSGARSRPTRPPAARWW